MFVSMLSHSQCEELQVRVGHMSLLLYGPALNEPSCSAVLVGKMRLNIVVETSGVWPSTI